ncbi:hypothetical protein [Amycolatopsis sp. YIM 10]|uniref:hypothetical protein n=1 Tax=Amycolatopsis sp. YIM 10 TaxID=2653857 RepID=UPI00128FD0BB|nr:hypothetical protein [Amycolatopsis sp. YIM 10]QFU94083.1 hypothetical protein YIM_44760 [Amycolatopsis sp. YIM 10]
MNWAAERRANRAAEAEQDRLNADAASARRIAERNALAEQARADAALLTKQKRAEREAKAARRAAFWARLRTWATAHTVDLLIYPLAIASAIMAIPSMARFGWDVYGNATGVVLPVLSELGMWAFAVATTASRRAHPDRPVWALQAGVWMFALVAFGLNVLHGLSRGMSAAVVMGVASIAGVLAHQLVTATPRRAAADRRAARVDRRAARKVAKVQRAAVRQAVAEIDAAGRASLVYVPGRYCLSGRGRLVEAVVPGMPVEPPAELAEVLGDEVSAWLATQARPSIPEPDSGPVATLDHSGDQRKSTPTHPSPQRQKRTLADLRREFADAVATDSIDPKSAESIRKTLRCSPARARQLRDEYRKGNAA